MKKQKSEEIDVSGVLPWLWSVGTMFLSYLKSWFMLIFPKTEVEKKFLVLGFQPNQIKPEATILQITQIYLDRPDRKAECRIRAISEEGKVKYFYTEKKPTKNAWMRKEREVEIPHWFFRKLHEDYAHQDCRMIQKTRYQIPFEGRVLELDVYTGCLTGLVILEIEFPNLAEAEQFALPQDFDLIEVTEDKRYSNRQLAEKGIPTRSY